MRWGLAAWLVVGLLMPVSAKAERLDCTIHGVVYGADEVSQVDATIEMSDLCGIRFQRFERTLVFLSKRWRVEVDIPKEQRGWTNFYYHWGNSTAYFGAVAVPVAVGPIEQS